MRFGEAKSETDAARHVFEVQVYLGDLDPDAVQVELYADGMDGGASGATRDDAGPATGGRGQRLRLSRAVPGLAPGCGLYRARDTAIARVLVPLEASNPLAAMSFGLENRCSEKWHSM